MRLSHIERHTGKTVHDLVDRMMKDWKSNSGCLYDSAINSLESFILKQNLHEGENIIELNSHEPMGMFVDRNYQIWESRSGKCVIDKQGDDISLLHILNLMGMKNFLVAMIFGPIPCCQNLL